MKKRTNRIGRSDRIYIRVTDYEKKILKEIADEKEMSISSYIRSLISEAIEKKFSQK